jgi:hypothetical protein
LVDNRAIEFEHHRPQMKWPNGAVDNRNKDVVIHSTLMSGLYGSNNNLGALTAANGAKSVSFYLTGYLSKDKCALASTASLMYEAMLHSRKYPSQADDIGDIQRSNIQILQRTLNSICGKNQELSATMAAFCLLEMPSSMSSRKFWFAFVKPALAMQKTLFPDEAVTSSRGAKNDQQNKKRDSASDCSSDSDENNDNENKNNNDSESDNDEERIQTTKNGCDEIDVDDATDSDKEAQMDVISAPPKFVPEREDFVINFGSADEDGDEDDGSSEIIRKPNGSLAIVEQHMHYMYRGDELREMNYDEYASLVTVVLKRKDGKVPEPNDVDREGSDDDSDDTDDDETQPAATATTKRRIAVRKRNGTFSFSPEHPLADSFEQRLRSDPRIVRVGGSTPCFPGPMVEDSPSWERAAQKFAEFMIVFLCPWNPTTFHPERFDEASGEYVDVPLNWNGLCDWIEILYDRAAMLQETADQKCVLKDDPETKEKKVVFLQDVEDPKPWLSGRLFRFRNLASGLRTTVGLRNSNAWFRHRASTRWNNANRELINPSEDNMVGTVVEHSDHAADEQMAREVDMAIKWVEQEVASMHDDSDSVKSRQKRAHNAAIGILQDLCSTDEVMPRSVSADSIVIPEEDLRAITQKLEKPNENTTEQVKMDSDDAAKDASMPIDDVVPPNSASAKCNDEQAAAMKVVMDWLRAQLQHEAGGHSTKVPAVPKILIHGPGGTHCSKILQQGHVHTKYLMMNIITATQQVAENLFLRRNSWMK